MLSSLEGSAITRVKIQGVQHEITTIPGVVEDVTDIILNIKSLVVKNTSEQSKTIRIDRHEKGVVTAAHIIADESVQIINPEHILATMTDDVPFVIEMTVENGRGYRTWEENAGAREGDRRHPGRLELLAGDADQDGDIEETARSVRRPTTTVSSWRSGPTARCRRTWPWSKGRRSSTSI